MAGALALGPREVHVWTSRLSEGPPADLAVLNADERARGERIRVPDGRERWLTGRARLRAILARYLDVAPAAIELVVGEHGKPALAGGGHALEFNLSHADDLALYALARDRAVGVDAERVRADLDFVALARRGLDPEAAAELERTPEHERPARFARAWARHEARLKCVGVGLGAASDARSGRVTVTDLDVVAGFAGALALEGDIAIGAPVAIAPLVAGVAGCDLRSLALG
jgi:4'-phosphopantetheinyl transferase